MKVWLDAQPLLGRRTGIGRYVQKLVENLAQAPDVDVYYWFNQLFKNRHLHVDLDRAKVKNSRYPYKVIRRLFKPNWLYHLPIDWKEEFDLFHGGNYITYKMKKAKNVITIHDLAFLRFPEVTSERIYTHHTKWLPLSIALADHIITDSYQSKQDIMHYYHVDESKISVVYLAADEDIQKVEAASIVAKVRDKYALPKEYVLYVGTIEPRKNIPFLIETFVNAKKAYHFPHQLVIVGGKGWKYEAVEQMMERKEIMDNVQFCGYVEEQDLASIYSGASLFIFPSLFEGFGLPVLEAMQCGVPVLASNVSSLPEVVGDAGLLLDLDKPIDWIDSIGELLVNEGKRKFYGELGFARAKQFSWQQTTKETIKVYQEVLR